MRKQHLAVRHSFGPQDQRRPTSKIVYRAESKSEAYLLIRSWGYPHAGQANFSFDVQCEPADYARYNQAIDDHTPIGCAMPSTPTPRSHTTKGSQGSDREEDLRHSRFAIPKHSPTP